MISLSLKNLLLHINYILYKCNKLTPNFNHPNYKTHKFNNLGKLWIIFSLICITQSLANLLPFDQESRYNENELNSVESKIVGHSPPANVHRAGQSPPRHSTPFGKPKFTWPRRRSPPPLGVHHIHGWVPPPHHMQVPWKRTPPSPMHHRSATPPPHHSWFAWMKTPPTSPMTHHRGSAPPLRSLWIS